MNFLKKIDHYLLTNHPVLWRTKVHYFVLFSLILGNIAAMFIGELLDDDKGTTIVFGIIFLIFSMLFWMISQARNKIKHYRFWDEVLTFGVYMLCALMLYINFIVLIKITITAHVDFRHLFEYSSILFVSVFVFLVSTLVYLIAHTGVRTILGILILHLIVLPFIGILSGTHVLYVMLFALLFPLFYFISDNNPTYRFIRFFLIPYIPLTVFICSINIIEPGFLVAQSKLAFVWGWVTILLMLISAIFGSALIIKHNMEPSS